MWPGVEYQLVVYVAKTTQDANGDFKAASISFQATHNITQFSISSDDYEQVNVALQASAAGNAWILLVPGPRAMWPDDLFSQRNEILTVADVKSGNVMRSCTIAAGEAFIANAMLEVSASCGRLQPGSEYVALAYVANDSNPFQGGHALSQESLLVPSSNTFASSPTTVSMDKWSSTGGGIQFQAQSAGQYTVFVWGQEDLPFDWVDRVNGQQSACSVSGNTDGSLEEAELHDCVLDSAVEYVVVVYVEGEDDSQTTFGSLSEPLTIPIYSNVFIGDPKLQQEPIDGDHQIQILAQSKHDGWAWFLAVSAHRYFDLDTDELKSLAAASQMVADVMQTITIVINDDYLLAGHEFVIVALVEGADSSRRGSRWVGTYTPWKNAFTTNHYPMLEGHVVATAGSVPTVADSRIQFNFQARANGVARSMVVTANAIEYMNEIQSTGSLNGVATADRACTGDSSSVSSWQVTSQIEHQVEFKDFCVFVPGNDYCMLILLDGHIRSLDGAMSGRDLPFVSHFCFTAVSNAVSSISSPAGTGNDISVTVSTMAPLGRVWAHVMLLSDQETSELQQSLVDGKTDGSVVPSVASNRMCSASRDVSRRGGIYTLDLSNCPVEAAMDQLLVVYAEDRKRGHDGSFEIVTIPSRGRLLDDKLGYGTNGILSSSIHVSPRPLYNDIRVRFTTSRNGFAYVSLADHPTVLDKEICSSALVELQQGILAEVSLPQGCTLQIGPQDYKANVFFSATDGSEWILSGSSALFGVSNVRIASMNVTADRGGLLHIQSAIDAAITSDVYEFNVSVFNGEKYWGQWQQVDLPVVCSSTINVSHGSSNSFMRCDGMDSISNYFALFSLVNSHGESEKFEPVRIRIQSLQTGHIQQRNGIYGITEPPILGLFDGAGGSAQVTTLRDGIITAMIIHDASIQKQITTGVRISDFFANVPCRVTRRVNAGLAETLHLNNCHLPSGEAQLYLHHYRCTGHQGKLDGPYSVSVSDSLVVSRRALTASVSGAVEVSDITQDSVKVAFEVSGACSVDVIGHIAGSDIDIHTNRICMKTISFDAADSIEVRLTGCRFSLDQSHTVTVRISDVEVEVSAVFPQQIELDQHDLSGFVTKHVDSSNADLASAFTPSDLQKSPWWGGQLDKDYRVLSITATTASNYGLSVTAYITPAAASTFDAAWPSCGTEAIDSNGLVTIECDPTNDFFVGARIWLMLSSTDGPDTVMQWKLSEIDIVASDNAFALSQSYSQGRIYAAAGPVTEVRSVAVADISGSPVTEMDMRIDIVPNATNSSIESSRSDMFAVCLCRSAIDDAAATCTGASTFSLTAGSMFVIGSHAEPKCAP